MRILVGDVREKLAELDSGSVRCCVTSPPYWGGIRDYGHGLQIGGELSPAEYADSLVEVFTIVRRVLADDGTLWLNIGEVYAAGGRGGGGSRAKNASLSTVSDRTGWRAPPPGYKPKDQTLTPFIVADALRRHGWYLRSTIIWDKSVPTEPRRADRPSQSHEYLFLLSQSEQYFWRRDLAESWSTVWSVLSERGIPHPATMPVELARRCIALGSRHGDTILDPFCGSGTTGVAATKLGREFVGIELNEHYATMADRRVKGTPLALELGA